MNWIMKWLTVPLSNQTTTVEVPDMWEVRWSGGSWDSFIGQPQHFWKRREHVEVFLEQAQADAFADSLMNAFRLLRLKGYQRVRVRQSSTEPA